MEKIKDLQDFFEQLGTKDFKRLTETLDKKSLNPTTVNTINGYIFSVYAAEKGLAVDEVEFTEKEFEDLIDIWGISVALWESVLAGRMVINGRLMLTDSESYTVSMTPKGIKYVENMIGKI